MAATEAATETEAVELANQIAKNLDTDRKLTHIRARTERICSEERHFSLAIFLHSLMRANSIKSEKCLQKVY